MTIFADRADRESHCGTELFEVLANRVDSNATLLAGVGTSAIRVDLFAKDSLESFRQGFAQFQTEAMVSSTSGRDARCCSVFAGHFPPKPPRCFESAAAGSIRKFHLGKLQDRHVWPDKISSSISRSSKEFRSVLFAAFSRPYQARALQIAFGSV